MSVRIGRMAFDSWSTLPLAEKNWSDTFIFPLSVCDGLPPSDYAGIISTFVPFVQKVRRSASLWVRIQDNPTIQGVPCRWFLYDLKLKLRGIKMAYAVTAGALPRCTDFSFMPWTSSMPSPAPPQIEDLYLNNLDVLELRCLQVLHRLNTAYTSHIASLTKTNPKATRDILLDLLKKGYVEKHKTDEGEIKYPYWELTRRGKITVLRSWGVPSGAPIKGWRERRVGGTKKNEKQKQTNQVRFQLRASRLWFASMQKAWPHVETWAGWSEAIIGYNAKPSLIRPVRPDGLVWGALDNQETLFWLEVEDGHHSRKELRDRQVKRFERALEYAQSCPVNLVFVVASRPWISEAIISGFQNIPESAAVVLVDWKNFGDLPLPVWSKAIIR